MLTAPSDRRSPPPAQAQLTSERASRPPWPPRRGKCPVRPEQQSGWAFLGRRSNPGFGLFASTSIGSRRPEISGSADAGQSLADGCSAPGFALVRHAGPQIAVPSAMERSVVLITEALTRIGRAIDLAKDGARLVARRETL